jgi:hypothetical protein
VGKNARATCPVGAKRLRIQDPWFFPTYPTGDNGRGEKSWLGLSSLHLENNNLGYLRHSKL